MKKNLYLTILAIVTVICVIVGSVYHITGWFGFGSHSILGRLFSVVTGYDNDSKRDRSHVTYSEDLDAFEDIEIDTSVMDITINTGNSYHLEYDCVAFLKPEMSVKDNIFKLEQPSVRHLGSNNKCKMTLTVPSGTVLDNADILSNVGDIKVYNTEIKDITVEADVGNISLESCTFATSDVEGDVGNINIITSNIGNSNIETNTGNIVIDSCEFYDIDLYNDIGDVTLNTNADLSNYEIDLSTDVGSIKYKGENKKREYYQSASGTSPHYSIEIETDVGNIVFN